MWVDDEPIVFTVDEVMTPDECSQLVARIEQLGPEDAPIKTPRGFVMRPDVRNNTRVMFDDHALARMLFERLFETIPTPLEGLRAVGANERFRCYRYEPGQRFAPHYDGSFRRDRFEVSQLTLMVYLNDGFGGGETAFHDLGGRKVVPRTGMALLFQHHTRHEGCEVTSGVKYVLRSDVMYRAEAAAAAAT